MASESRLRRWFKLAAVFGSLCFALLVAEGGARLFEKRGGHSRLFTEFDPLLGWRKIPGKSGVMKTGEYEVTESINARGLRGPVVPHEKPDGEYRVLVLGDSFVEGYTVEDDQHSTAVMMRLLDAAPGETRFEVINAGTGGYSTDQELLFFTSEGHKYRPDLTVLVFFDNDTWYNAQSKYTVGAKPVFHLDESGNLQLQTSHVVPLSQSGSALAGFLWDHSHLYRRIRRKLARPGRLEDANAAYQMPLSEQMIMAWRVTTEILGELKKETAEIGSGLLVVYTPGNYAIYEDVASERLEKYGQAAGERDFGRVARDLEQACAEHGIPYLDLTPLLKAEAAKGNILYFRKDGHWNLDGHRRVGEWLAAAVLEKQKQ